jgi:hypothetical protein
VGGSISGAGILTGPDGSLTHQLTERLSEWGGAVVPIAELSLTPLTSNAPVLFLSGPF